MGVEGGVLHYLYLEEFQNGEWVYKGRVVCECPVGENHWKERP